MTPLVTTSFAGQQIAVLPLTIVVAEDALAGDSLLRDRPRSLALADSLLGDALTGRSPEVKWVLPPDLRKIARRAPGMVVDPDRMGQGVMRAQNLDQVPDPFRSSLRSLVAVAGGRFALIPAAVGFLKEPDGQVRAEVSLVLADARSGKVLWRTVATGFGDTPPQAYRHALEQVFPLVMGMP